MHSFLRSVQTIQPRKSNKSMPKRRHSICVDAPPCRNSSRDASQLDTSTRTASPVNSRNSIYGFLPESILRQPRRSSSVINDETPEEKGDGNAPKRRPSVTFCGISVSTLNQDGTVTRNDSTQSFQSDPQELNHFLQLSNDHFDIIQAEKRQQQHGIQSAELRRVRTRSSPRKRHSICEMESPSPASMNNAKGAETLITRRPSIFRKCNSDGWTAESSNQYNEKCAPSKQPQHYYILGETARSSHDIGLLKNKPVAFTSISCLKLYDFAFVERSNGEFTYSILADRYFAKSSAKRSNGDAPNTDDSEECMRFVISEKGHTKFIRKRHWAKKIRPVCTTAPSTNTNRTQNSSTSRSQLCHLSK